MKIVAPHRASQSYRQSLRGSAERVFALLCPVREAQWAVGWEPNLVISASGVVEEDCVFTTPAGAGEAIWYVTRHEPHRWFVEMLKITPGVTACRLQIQLHPQDSGCAAEVTYTHTSLGPGGEAFVAAFTGEHYAGFMRAWERELNHFLVTGQRHA